MSDIKYLIEKATSSLLLEPDWDSTLQIVDQIRQGDITPKYVVSMLLSILDDPNPNVVLQALHVLEAVVKNCGEVIHEYVTTRDCMDQIHAILQRCSNDKVRNKILSLLATWLYVFRNEPKYRAVQDTVNILKAEGYHLPSVSECDAMYTADRAPVWADGECCHRCRSQFTILRRKHHCRACGQVFCSDCSGKMSTIPKFGIERDVRVCDSCYDDINNPQPKPKTETLPAESKSTKPVANKKSAQELQEEEELLLALALSKSEAENKEMKLRTGPKGNSVGDNWAPPVKQKTPEADDNYPELAKYLNRSYWEEHHQKNLTKTDYRGEIGGKSSPPPSAPENIMHTQMPMKITETYQNGGSGELDDFVSTLRSQLEIFVNRMKSNQSRGRPIANDSAVQSLFMNITAMHAQLLKHIQEQDRKRVYYEQLQDKISQVRDARAALEALREEHREKIRREKEEQERQRQIQMMQKLEIMRKKKQEYLEYQRQLALHRMAESERQIFNQGSPAPVAPASAQGFPPMVFPTGYPNHQVGNYMPPQPPVGQFAGQAQSVPNSNGFSSGTVPVPPLMQPPITSPPAAQSNSEFGIYNMQGMVQNLPPATSYNAGVPPTTVQLPVDTTVRQHEIPNIPPSQNQEQAELISFD